jgi:hypothetical protein
MKHPLEMEVVAKKKPMQFWLKLIIWALIAAAGTGIWKASSVKPTEQNVVTPK